MDTERSTREPIGGQGAPADEVDQGIEALRRSLEATPAEDDREGSALNSLRVVALGAL